MLASDLIGVICEQIAIICRWARPPVAHADVPAAPRWCSSCPPCVQVIELASPAEHVTHREHDKDMLGRLSNGSAAAALAQPERRSGGGGQRFLFHQARHATWHDGSPPG